MQVDLPVVIKVAGNHCLYGVGQGFLVVQVLDHIGSRHSVQLPVTIVLGLGCHILSGASPAARGVTVTIAMNSYIDIGAFAIPVRKDCHCSSLHHLDLTTDATGRRPETAFPTISDTQYKPKAVLAVRISTATEATSPPKHVPANIGQKRLGHPKQVMARTMGAC